MRNLQYASMRGRGFLDVYWYCGLQALFLELTVLHTPVNVLCKKTLYKRHRSSSELSVNLSCTIHETETSTRIHGWWKRKIKETVTEGDNKIENKNSIHKNIADILRWNKRKLKIKKKETVKKEEQTTDKIHNYTKRVFMYITKMAGTGANFTSLVCSAALRFVLCYLYLKVRKLFAQARLRMLALTD